MWGNTIIIHSVLRKKITKLNSQPAQYKKKIDKDNSRKKIIKKNYVEKHYNNPQCFKKRNYKAKFSTSSTLKK
jgi:hypothetical protein